MHLEVRAVNALDDPSVAGLILTSRDVTEMHLHDPLTGLASRALLLDRLGQALATRTEGGRRELAVLAIGFEEFAAASDVLGVSVEEHLLKTVAERLRAAVRPQDTVARAGPDLLVVLLRDLAEVQDAWIAAIRLRDSLASPIVAGEREIRPTVAMGLALDARAFDSAEEMLRAATTAMRRSLTTAGSSVELFDPAAARAAKEALEVRGTLFRALDNREFEVYFQPIVTLSSRETVGYEALARWHPGGEILLPERFVPAAERSGQVVELDLQILRAGLCRLARSPGAAWLAVNLSARTLQSPGLCEEVAAALTASGVRASRLHLELTETAIPDDDEERARRALDRLRADGVRIALDDFGTGWSSLSRLLHLPLDMLKIDRSFDAELGTARPADAVVPAMIDLAHSLDLEVVAEGVETEAQHERLLSLGCDYGQGWLYGEPSPPPPPSG